MGNKTKFNEPENNFQTFNVYAREYSGKKSLPNEYYIETKQLTYMSDNFSDLAKLIFNHTSLREGIKVTSHKTLTVKILDGERMIERPLFLDEMIKLSKIIRRKTNERVQ